LAYLSLLFVGDGLELIEELRDEPLLTDILDAEIFDLLLRACRERL
jgi:hypothetical protein